MIQKLTPELIKQWTTQANRWRLDTVQEFTYSSDQATGQEKRAPPV